MGHRTRKFSLGWDRFTKWLSRSGKFLKKISHRLSVTKVTIAAKKGYYFSGLNEYLLRAVPMEAKEILEVGCAEGRLGEAIRALVPGRHVYGIELDPVAAERAASRLDRVLTLDLEREAPDFAPASLDLILFGDVLEHLVDPGGVLRRYAPLLRPGGRILCCIPNVQHHSVLSSLLRGDFQYQESGLLDATHLRFFTWASFSKLLLDGGFAPGIRDTIRAPMRRDLKKAFQPLFAHLKVDPERGAADLSTYQWIFEGTPLNWERNATGEPISFIACINDESQLAENLAVSPCFHGDVPHELITVRGAANIAEGFKAGLAQASHELVVLVHQDVYLPVGWPDRFLQQWHQAEARFGKIGVAGVYGVAMDGAAPKGIIRAGHVMDRQILLREAAPLPALVQTLDELLLAVRRDTTLSIDPALGFHFYGADLGLQAWKAGLAVVALDALCFHNSLTGTEYGPDFHQSGEVLKAKWSGELPIATACTVLR